jgi:hypothetical protein
MSSASPRSSSPIRLLVLDGLLMLAAFVAGGTCVYWWLNRTTGPQLYESTAQVMVIKNTPKGASDPQWDEDPMVVSLSIISSPTLIERAVKDGKLDQLASLRSQGDPVANIRGALNGSWDSTPSGNKGILNLSYRCTDPKDCKIILTALLAGYQKNLQEHSFNFAADPTGQLLQMNEKLENEYFEKQREYSALLKGGPLLIGKDGTTIDEEHLAAIRKRQSELLIRRTELEARLDAIEKERNQMSLLSAARLLSGSVTTRVVSLDRQSLLEQLNDVRVIEKALEEVVAKESAIVREMKDFRSKEAGLRQDIGRIKDLLGTINGKVLDAQLERDRPTYETLVLDAPEAGKPILGR